MTSATTVQGERHWNYYRCHRRAVHGARSCPQKKALRTEPLENDVWRSVFNLLTDPERLRVGLEELIAREKGAIHRDPLKQTEALANMLENVAGKRRRYQDMADEGLIGFDELRSRLAELDDVRKTTERELESLRRRRDHIAELEHDGINMEQYAEQIPADLESLAPEARHRVYRLLRLQVVPGQDGNAVMTGVIGAANSICQSQTTSDGEGRRDGPRVGHQHLLRHGGRSFAAHAGAHAQPRPHRALRQGRRLAHVAFTVDGLEETVERLKGEGVKVTLEPKTLTADGNDYRISFIEDPDGYKIELVERGTMKVGEMYQ